MFRYFRCLRFPIFLVIYKDFLGVDTIHGEGVASKQ